MLLALIKIAAVSVCALVLTCSTAQQIARQNTSVLFICEHGNVKSLMAASYFNLLALQSGLRYRAVSRGTDPNSTTVPSAIINRPRSRWCRRELVSSVEAKELRHRTIGSRDHDWN
jgi:hypothetical protein